MAVQAKQLRVPPEREEEWTMGVKCELGYLWISFAQEQSVEYVIIQCYRTFDSAILSCWTCWTALLATSCGIWRYSRHIYPTK